ncbi:hypothetical protein LRS13_02840 [Svornostia abyssi]|uniref:Uncharacterized protein n=1 Tax=Svornostia abyssi TaxID=2898438 RepID=A0ABY5PII3_9ACTN|nr:hypothetical protein LRS13_02840 [Parviterribacteraceae bacterium J379]
MASIVRRPGRRWEIRESVSGLRGPRSRTLATFSVLSPEVLDHATARASRPLDSDELCARARRAGAPVQTGRADEAAGALLAALADGERLRPGLARLLADALPHAGEPTPTDASRAAAAWVGRSLSKRSAALVDLLLLTDALPVRPRAGRPRMPRIASAP